MTRNPALYRAAKAYVSTAIDLIASRLDPKSDIDSNEQAFFFALLSASDQIVKLQEYENCLGALLSDSIIAPQIDVLAGTNSGIRQRTQTPEVLMRMLVDLGVRNGHPVFDEEHFDTQYSQFETAYYSPNISYDVIAPLPNVAISRPVHLSHDLELIQLNHEELNPPHDRRTTAINIGWFDQGVSVVRSKCELPKAFGEYQAPDLEKRKEDETAQFRVNERIGDVVGALRLCGVENAYISGILYRTSRWAFDRERYFPGRIQSGFPYTSPLEEAWLQGFEEFWKKLQSDGVEKRKFLDIAIRRFSDSYNRDKISDKIIDLMIAAEALFLSNQSKKYAGELRYRLALRAALFLANERETQKRIFRWMRAAYDLRSTVVHGDDFEKVKFPKADGGSHVTPEVFISTIQTYLRHAIHKAIEIAQEPGAPMHLVDWDELPFSTSGS